MTRSWNQTKNNSNLRHIATGYLRTYKSRNLNEAIATVRIGRDINIYIHMYIYENHCNRTRITIRKPSFSSAELRHGEIQVSSNGMNKRTLLVVPYVLRIPSLKYPNIEFHSKKIKHFALQAFFLVPHFSSAMHFFFLTVQSSEAFWNWRAWAETSHALRKQRKQFFPLSTRRQISSIVRRRYSAVPRQTWIIGIQLFKNYSSAFVVSSLLYPLNKASGHCATAVLPHILHTFPSGRLDVLYQT